MRFVCLISQLINPCRLWKLTPEQSVFANDLAHIVKLAQRAKKLPGAPIGSEKEEKYHQACRRLNN